jgi:hypothetical protein
MSPSGKLPEYPSTYKILKFCFYFPVLTELGHGGCRGREKGE